MAEEKGRKWRDTRRSHFIPRFLLAGFASRTSGDETYAWVFRMGAKPFESNIKSIGVEKDFYGKGTEDSLEHALNPMEGRFAATVARLRSAECVKDVDGQLLWELVAHLGVRSKHMRLGMRDFLNQMTAGFRSIMLSPEGNEAIARTLGARWESMSESLVRQLAQMAGVPPEDPKVQQAVDRVRASKESALADIRRSDMSASLGPFIDSFWVAVGADRFPAKAQVESLQKWLAQRAQWNAKDSRRWYLIKYTSDALVLGDVVVLGGEGPGARLSPLISAQSSGTNIYLPVSSSLLLVGSVLDHPMDVPADWINACSIACSREFAVSSRRSAFPTDYSETMGTDSAYLSTEDASKIITEYLRTLIARPPQS